NIAMPWLLNSKTDLNVGAGPYAAFLGQAYDPVWTDFVGEGTHVTPNYTDGQARPFKSPFGGIEPGGYFHPSSAGQLSDDVSPSRLGLRRSLLEQFDRGRLQLESHLSARAFDNFQEMAFSLVTSSRVREALDIGREPMSLRENYGMTLFGQSCLAAR